MDILSNDRVLVSKLDNDERSWSVISNPEANIFMQSMSTMLFNAANDYVEYRNCGVRHRMIRFCDLEKYGINESDVKKEHTLPAIRQATIDRRAAMRNLIEQWRKLADENSDNESMADAMDPEVFATCIQAHRIKRELYDQCADQLEAALSNSGAPAEQTGNTRCLQL